MKVFHIITRMIVGGAQETVLLGVHGLAALPQYDVTLITGPETGPEGNLFDHIPPDVRVVYEPRLVRAVNPQSDVLALLALRRLLEKERPDVVHTHSSKAGVIGRAAARWARVPVIVHTYHGRPFHAYQDEWVNRFYIALERSAQPLTDHYISVADDLRRRLVSVGIGRNAGYSVIRAGFPTNEFVSGLLPRREARAALGLPDDRVIVGVVARLFPLKGHDDILSVAERVVPRAPEVLFALIGGGPLQQALEHRVARTGLQDHVRFFGLLPPDMMPTVFSSFDMLAHASVREGLARVYSQAILAGIPLVCYDLDGSDEVVQDGVNGFLIRTGDLNAFADRLCRLIGDEPLRRSMGGVRREWIEREFSSHRMVEQLDELYRTLLRGNGSRRRANRVPPERPGARRGPRTARGATARPAGRPAPPSAAPAIPATAPP